MGSWLDREVTLSKEVMQRCEPCRGRRGRVPHSPCLWAVGAAAGSGSDGNTSSAVEESRLQLHGLGT